MDETSAELLGAAEAREDVGATARPAGILRAAARPESEPGASALLSAFANSHGSHGPAERERTIAADRRVALDAGFSQASGPRDDSTLDGVSNGGPPAMDVVQPTRLLHHAASLPIPGADAARPGTSPSRWEILRALQDDGQRDDEDSTGDRSLYGTRVAACHEEPAKQAPLTGGVWSMASLVSARWKNKVQADPGRPPDDVAAADGGSLEQNRASLPIARKANGDKLPSPARDGTNDTDSAQDDTDKNGPPQARPKLSRTMSVKKLKAATTTMINSRRIRRENVNKRLWERTRSAKQKVAWYEEIYHMDSRVMANATNFSIVASLVDVCFLMYDAVGFHGCSQACHDAGGRFDPASREFRGYLGSTSLGMKLFSGIVADICHIMFLVVSFRTVRNRSKAGEEESTPKRKREVAMRYLVSRFPMDLISCAPFYW